MSTKPLYQFDVYISRCHNGDSYDTTSWKATIDRASFPNIDLSNYNQKTFHLNEYGYQDCFKVFLQLYDFLSPKLFDYSVNIDDDNLVITALTETTVRAAIVDLITFHIPHSQVKLVRQPTNYRVYIPPIQDKSTSLEDYIKDLEDEEAMRKASWDPNTWPDSDNNFTDF